MTENEIQGFNIEPDSARNTPDVLSAGRVFLIANVIFHPVPDEITLRLEATQGTILL